MKIKYIFFTLASLAFFSTAQAQVKVGNNPTIISPSAALEVESTNKGFLPPRVALTGINDATTIPSPATGLTVYNTSATSTLDVGLSVNTGTPSAPIWSLVNVTDNSQGGNFSKLIYRGNTDPFRTLKAGLFEYRLRADATYTYLDIRLIDAPSNSVSVQGQRLGWVNTGSSSGVTPLAINRTFTPANYNTYQQIDFMFNGASHMFYLDVTGQDKFLRVSTYSRINQYNSILVEAF